MTVYIRTRPYAIVQGDNDISRFSLPRSEVPPLTACTILAAPRANISAYFKVLDMSVVLYQSST